MTDSRPIFIEWCAKDALDGMMTLSPMEELAYRRVLDLIYATDDNLPDDDKKLGWMTKVGYRQWQSIKKTLTNDGKIELTEDGRISNKKCREKLQKAHHIIEQKVSAGKARQKNSNSLIPHKTGSAAAGANGAAGAIASAPANHKLRKKESTLVNSDKSELTRAAPNGSASHDPDADLYRRGREILGPKEAGAIITKLKRAKSGSIAQARAALEMASEKHDPKEYLMAVIQKREHRDQPRLSDEFI